MPISKRTSFVCKLFIQLGLAAGLLIVLSGCGKYLFVWPEFKLAEKEKPEEIIAKETIIEEEGIPEAEEAQMASAKSGDSGATQGFSALESERSPKKDEGPPTLFQDNTVSAVDEADSNLTAAKNSDPTPKVETPPETDEADSRFTPDETSDVTAAAISPPEKDQGNSLSKIYFRYKKTVLNREALDILAKNLNILKKNKNLKLEIEGHCDSVGSRDYNQALGQARADAVKDFFVKNGIESSRLKAISYGKDLLVCHEDVETCQKQNRRVELVKID